MTFKEDFKPSRVYNKLVIDAIKIECIGVIVRLVSITPGHVKLD